jgi:serine protease inhibitor
MIRFALLTTLCVCALSAPHAPAARADETGTEQVSAEAKRLSDAHNRFGFKLFNKISSTDFGENIFISPASAAFALAMLYNGSEGTTRAEMTDALELGTFSLEEVNEANASLMASLNEGDSSVELAVANSIWCRNTFQFRQDFLERTSKSYAAEIAALDFDDTGAVDIINGWVKESTRDKIKSIVDEISPLDVMFLINAVYFKGSWTYPFLENLTSDGAFNLLDGSTVDIPMMQQTEDFRYFETGEFQAIRLPYGDESFSMLLFLPAAESGLEKFAADLSRENWAEWQNQFRSRDVNIVMPRFKLEYDRMLNEPLEALGMKTAFNGELADLTGLWDPAEVSSQNLYVSFVRQKTFLEVNEEGTEAAAVTGIGVSIASMPPPPVQMKVDRPFFCAIVDDTTGLILFMGAIVDPS